MFNTTNPNALERAQIAATEKALRPGFKQAEITHLVIEMDPVTEKFTYRNSHDSVVLEKDEYNRLRNFETAWFNMLENGAMGKAEEGGEGA